MQENNAHKLMLWYINTCTHFFPLAAVILVSTFNIFHSVLFNSSESSAYLWL